MAQSKEFPQYRWVPPRSYTRGRKAGQPTVIFIHTTEGSEGRNSAEDGAAYDARRTDGTSTHFFCDQDTTVQCVLTTDEAHAARSTGNDVGIQIEVCGKAGQSIKQWGDAASAGSVEQAAILGVALREKYGTGRFPLVNLTPAQLRAGGRGFAEHYDATRAWPGDGGTHTDPGPNFPWGKLFARIRALEAEAMRKLTYQSFTGRLPILKYGDQDPIEGEGTTWWVLRVQRWLQVADDGIYGDDTAAAVRKMMGEGTGKTVDFPVWQRVVGLWDATLDAD